MDTCRPLSSVFFLFPCSLFGEIGQIRGWHPSPLPPLRLVKLSMTVTGTRIGTDPCTSVFLNIMFTLVRDRVGQVPANDEGVPDPQKSLRGTEEKVLQCVFKYLSNPGLDVCENIHIIHLSALVPLPCSLGLA